VGGTLAAAAGCAPLVALTVRLHAQAGGWVWTVLPLGLGHGLLLAYGGPRLAALWTAARLPEILTAVSRA
jgi:ABC-2 type transport system permease protein